jgi:hypothetical protein
MGVFLARGTTKSRVDLTVNGGGKRSEIRNNLLGPVGRWINPDGRSGKYAPHNCWTDAAWFFPAFSSLANVDNPRFVFSYLGEETWNGLATKHLRVYQTQLWFKEAQRLSTMDFYLDPSSLLVLRVTYSIHPDNNMSVNLPAEVRFADYKLVNGAEVPFHIQHLQGSALVMDIAVSSASFNSGLSDANFDTH